MTSEGLIEKYVCRGGGIRLTRKGERQNPKYTDVSSGFDNEAALYQPFIKFLESQNSEKESQFVICDTHALKAKGQWQNPDITQIQIEYYHYLRKFSVSVITYEIKQFPKWNTESVYEAASHRRFAHEAHVLLEWPKEEQFSLTDPTYKIDQIARECQRFGIGLATLHQYHSTLRPKQRIEPIYNIPDNEDIESWLDYIFSRNEKAQNKYDECMRIMQDRLKNGMRP